MNTKHLLLVIISWKYKGLKMSDWIKEREYQNRNCDLELLVASIQHYFENRDFSIQTKSGNADFLVQASKSSATRSALGGSRDITVMISGESNDFSVKVGTGEWAKNLTATAVGTLLTGGLSLVGSGAATLWTKQIESDLWSHIENAIRFEEFEPLNEHTEEQKLEVQPSGLGRIGRSFFAIVALLWILFLISFSIFMMAGGFFELGFVLPILLFATPAYWPIKWCMQGQIGKDT